MTQNSEMRLLVAKLEEENKATLHQVYLLGEEVKRLREDNRRLIEGEASLVVANTEMKIVLERQGMEFRKMEGIVVSMQQLILKQNEALREDDRVIARLRNQNLIQNDNLPSENIGKRSFLKSSFMEYYQSDQVSRDSREILVESRWEDTIKQQHLINQLQTTKGELSHNNSILELQVSQLNKQLIEERVKSKREIEQQQISREQLITKNKHLSETEKILQNLVSKLEGEVGELRDMKYGLEITVNALNLQQEELDQKIKEILSSNNRLQEQVLLLAAHKKVKEEQLVGMEAKHQFQSQARFQQQRIQQERFQQEINDRTRQNQHFKDQVQVLSSAVQFLEETTRDNERQRISTLKTQQEYESLSTSHLNNLSLLHSKEIDCQSLSQRVQFLQTHIHNHTLTNISLGAGISQLKTQLLEEQANNKEIQKINKSLLNKIDVLEIEIRSRRRSNSRRQMNTSIEKMDSRSRMRARNTLSRIKSEESLGARIRGGAGLKGVSRIKEIFSSGEVVSSKYIPNNIGSKTAWRSLQDRIQTLKEQNEHLQKNTPNHKQ